MKGRLLLSAWSILVALSITLGVSATPVFAGNGLDGESQHVSVTLKPGESNKMTLVVNDNPASADDLVRIELAATNSQNSANGPDAYCGGW